MKVVQQLTCLTLGRLNDPAYSTGELLNTPQTASVISLKWLNDNLLYTYETDLSSYEHEYRGVHGNGSSHGNGVPMEFPWEWELDLNKDGNSNGNEKATTWDGNGYCL